MIDFEREINFDHLLETYDKGTLKVYSPINGNLVGVVNEDSVASTREKIKLSTINHLFILNQNGEKASVDQKNQKYMNKKNTMKVHIQ